MIEDNKIVLTATLNTKGPQLEANLDTKGPKLNAGFEAVGGIDNVRDVRINNESTVIHKIAQIETGEGLQYDNHVLKADPAILPRWVSINGMSGTLSETELEWLKTSKVAMLQFGPAVYKLAVIQGKIYKYCTTSPAAIYNEIQVDTDTGNYSVTQQIPYALQQHINNMEVHITQQERENWNNKVTTEIEVDPAGSGQYVLKLLKE